ncbi:unnamed protein product [Leptidea sinapis]|uniref:RNA polymerase II assembly factor Rtp1 C-terminal domain-containing protein n=1 Tax=Leptidea sinapis TaxID=189913 RepID=A0A5E4Q3S4_9NEOP|nr:unnamed protein product [Leptidea sinapis]
MADIKKIFDKLESFLDSGDEFHYIDLILRKSLSDNKEQTDKNFCLIKNFLDEVISKIDELSCEIKTNENILISVKNQKTLRNCFQVITSVGILNCLIPGLGIGISKYKNSVLVQSLPKLPLNDEEKYKLIILCIDFFQRSYLIPVLKNIIVTFHLSDYLAALIQIAFAPLKKPGEYKDFVMTTEKYAQLTLERQKYIQIYENLVTNCFQPMLMKELLVLHNPSDVEPPAFVKRIVSKELSRQLITPGGLLSLIRCFLDSHDIDVGIEWKKINMICKIVSVKHGDITLENYISNICSQLRNILTLNNTQYIATAGSCMMSLSETYPGNELVRSTLTNMITPFDYDKLAAQCMPGTVIFTVQEVEHYILILHACLCVTKLDMPVGILLKNMFILNQLHMKCSNDNMNSKVRDIVFKILEMCDDHSIYSVIKELFCGKVQTSIGISIEQYNSGILLKSSRNPIKHAPDEAVSYILHLYNEAKNTNLIENIYKSLLQLLLEFKIKRKIIYDNGALTENDVVYDDDKKYACILLMLSEISGIPKTVNIFKKTPSIALSFVEELLSDFNNSQYEDECVTVALVLLNSILSNTNKGKTLQDSLKKLMPTLIKIMKQSNDYNQLLCKEIIALINNECPQKHETALGKALVNVFDNLLPVKAHGVMEITKLIDGKDPETLSKRHYIFCLLQECLQDSDSYLYLSAINGIASLASHCTDDVLSVLCKEFLVMSTKMSERAIIHKTLLLNTFLCGCRDKDPLIRASAISNLAEIALVVHYRVGTIIYEGLGKETLAELKDNLLPIYRTLNRLYNDQNEDSIVKLHVQLALEELNDIVEVFLRPALSMEKHFVLNDIKGDIIFK